MKTGRNPKLGPRGLIYIEVPLVLCRIGCGRWPESCSATRVMIGLYRDERGWRALHGDAVTLMRFSRKKRPKYCKGSEVGLYVERRRQSGASTKGDRL